MEEQEPKPSQQRQFKMGYGTIGSRPCEMALNQILIETGDAYIASKVMGIHQAFKKVAKHFRAIFGGITNVEQKNLGRDCFKMLFNQFSNNATGLTNKGVPIPLIIRTHLICCLTAEHRQAMYDLGWKKQKGGRNDSVHYNPRIDVDLLADGLPSHNNIDPE